MKGKKQGAVTYSTAREDEVVIFCLRGRVWEGNGDTSEVRVEESLNLASPSFVLHGFLSILDHHLGFG